MGSEPLRHERYTHGHAPATVQHHARRTADEAAAFVLSELAAGMTVLDVGCGPGSITRGLAARVAPGAVVGVDLSRDTVETAQREAASDGIGNLRFEVGSVYELPFADGSFDVVYAHQVLQHLRDRDAAVREMLRVARPGGLVAVREVDWATVAYWPPEPWIDRFIDVHFRTWYRNGGEPRMGRRMRALFNAAGVDDLRVSASVWCYATRDETVAWGEAYANRLLTSPMGALPVEYGYATRAEVEEMAAAFRRWSVERDALWSFTHIAVLARRSG